jgi:hypothetical protein
MAYIVAPGMTSRYTHPSGEVARCTVAPVFGAWWAVYFSQGSEHSITYCPNRTDAMRHGTHLSDTLYRQGWGRSQHCFLMQPVLQLTSGSPRVSPSAGL